ncbi:Zinc finger protein Xfin [Folsomia candida]|uniref:Zinc finger protein Xfin n=2 Tax=Folsomia candida TaxID=158441 RepID=A0A226D1S3_FOLCA|nr:Zinc finger protein Xfin [Folsomia candida]
MANSHCLFCLQDLDEVVNDDGSQILLTSDVISSLRTPLHPPDLPSVTTHESCALCKNCYQVVYDIQLIRYYELVYQYPCTLCTDKFKQEKILAAHMVMKHELPGEKTLSCPRCAKKFNQQFNLDRHLANHEVVAGKEILFCDVCDTPCLNLDLLKRHVRTHDAKKYQPPNPYKCEGCDVTFITSGGLYTHERTIHMIGTPFFCKLCHRRFKEEAELLNHATVCSRQRIREPRV